MAARYRFSLINGLLLDTRWEWDLSYSYHYNRDHYARLFWQHMPLLKFSRHVTLSISPAANIDDVLIYFFDYEEKHYNDVTCRGDLIRFSLNPLLRMGLNNGISGSIQLNEEGGQIYAEMEVQNAFSMAQSILILLITNITGPAVWLTNQDDPEGWIYAVAFPLIGIAMYLLNAGLFQLFSYFRFRQLVQAV